MLFYVGHMGFRNEGERDEKCIESHVVEKRYKDTLIPIIKTSVEKGCKVYSGCWRANNSLKERTKVSNITQSIIVSTSRPMTVQAPRKSKGFGVL